jgi:hypothetical protein
MGTTNSTSFGMVTYCHAVFDNSEVACLISSPGTHGVYEKMKPKKLTKVMLFIIYQVLYTSTLQLPVGVVCIWYTVPGTPI